MSIVVYPSNENLGQTRFFYVGVFIISCLIITLLNCVSLIILSKPSMRSVKSNHFVVSLAVSDFVVSVLLCPMLAWSSWLPYDNPILISLVVLPHSLLTGSSTATLAAIAYDRYLLTRPSIYDTKMTPRKAKLILLAVWGVPHLNALHQRPGLRRPDFYFRCSGGHCYCALLQIDHQKDE